MMYTNLTNLLPLKRQRALVRGYYLRLGTLAALMVTTIVLASAVLLVPTYMLLVKSSGAKEAQLAALNSTLSSEDEKEISSRLTSLTERAAILVSLEQAPSLSKTLRSMLAVSHSGITLSAFTYAPSTAKVPRTLIITGVAATRDALRNYQLALQGTPSVLSAVLPVSVYAKDNDIPFSVTVALAL